MTYIITDTDIFNCFLFTGSEYYANSGFICIIAETNVQDFIPTNGSLTVGPAAAGSAGGELMVADYGSVWNFWIYDSDAGAVALNAQIVSHVMLVGTKGGKGVVGRQIVTPSGTKDTAANSTAHTRIITPDHEASGSATINGATVSGINTLVTGTDLATELIDAP